MSNARKTRNGLLIPNEWLRELGENVRVQRSKSVVIIESEARADARKRLAAVTKKLRKSAHELGLPTDDEVDAIVKEVRATRAGHH
jgi:hypothetical protein